MLVKSAQYILLLSALLLGCDAHKSDHKQQAKGPARNIILLIGDGMGAEHRKAARWALAGHNGQLAMDAMPVSGSLRTASANDAITDSAAAATAMATGTKTNNGVIGMDAELRHVSSILEQAQQLGKAVGLVTTTQVTHATPAAFTAHVIRRKHKPEIAIQMLHRKVDVILGGGEDEFYPTVETGCFPEKGKQPNGRNLIHEAMSAGYTHVCDPKAFHAIEPAATEKLLGLFADDGMQRPFAPTLGEMTQKAIAILSRDPDGFFLMVEAGQIDWASHDNDAVEMIDSVIGFDLAVNLAKDFALEQGNTLVIVTADHETGGVTVSPTSSGRPGEDGPFITPGATSFYINWATDEHTAADVPVTALGPHSDSLTGVQENTAVYETMRQAFGLAQ
jgi:alkaline phosphatase